MNMNFDGQNWVASGQGYLRPIVVEHPEFNQAMALYYHQCDAQYAEEQSYQAKSDMADGTYGEAV